MASAQAFVRWMDGRTRVLEVPRDGGGSTVRASAVLECMMAMEPEAPWEDVLVTRQGGATWDQNEAWTVDLGGMLPSCNLSLRLRGGKGGFGAQLRGTRTKMADNFDACRDLQGRRIRVVEAEKKMKKWEEEKKERELEQLAQEHIKKVERQKKKEQEAEIDIEKYQEVNNSIRKRTSSAVDEALEKLHGKRSAKVQKLDHRGKGKKSWDQLEDLYSSGENDSDGEEHPSPRQVHDSNGELDEGKEKHANQAEGTGNAPVAACAAEAEEVSGGSSKENDSCGSERTHVRSLHTGPSEVPFDITTYASVEELEALGLDRLKSELQALGLKCGGSLRERASRLFLLKSTPMSALDRKLFAKPPRQ